MRFLFTHIYTNLGVLLQYVYGWGGRIRTCECRYQKPVPYHLATPQQPLHIGKGERPYSERKLEGNAPIKSF
jgi:hypothetical protein